VFSLYGRLQRSFAYAPSAENACHNYWTIRTGKRRENIKRMPKYQQITQSEPDADKRDSSGWSASLYNKTASFVYSSANTVDILDLLDAKPGERILDVGCGSGELTVMLQEKLWYNSPAVLWSEQILVRAW